MNGHDDSALPRRIGFWSAVAVVVGSTIGSGIFRSPAGVAARLPGPLPMLAVWSVGGALALCGALTLAEVSSALPRTGGLYAFLRDGWGRLPAFLFGWAELVVIRAAAIGAVSITFAEYALRVAGLDPSAAPYDAYARYVAAAAIAATAGLNVVGVKWGSLVTNVTTAAKFGGLAAVVAAGLAVGFARGGAAHFAPAAPAGSFSAGAFGLALVSVLWALDGWADLSFVAGEVTEPRRNVPRALLVGTASVVAIYLLANVAYLAVLPVEGVRGSPLVAADVAARLVGRPGVVLVSATVMVSTFGTLNAGLLTAPRIFFAMAGDGLLFARVAAVHPRFQTPHVAVGVSAALGVAFVLARTFEQLADAFVTAIVPFYALGVASVFALRRRAGYAPAFRTPGYPVVPALFIASAALLLANAVADRASRGATLAVLGAVAAGVPVYYVTVGRRR